MPVHSNRLQVTLTGNRGWYKTSALDFTTCIPLFQNSGENTGAIDGKTTGWPHETSIASLYFHFHFKFLSR